MGKVGRWHENGEGNASYEGEGRGRWEERGNREVIQLSTRVQNVKNSRDS